MPSTQENSTLSATTSRKCDTSERSVSGSRCELQVGLVPRITEEAPDLADQDELRVLRTGCFLQDGEGGHGLPVDVARAEDLEHFVDQPANVDGSALGGIDLGEIERCERGVVVESELKEGIPDLPEGHRRLLVPLQPAGDGPFQPTEAQEVQPVSLHQVE